MADAKSTSTEEWRFVHGLEGRYEISDIGRVRSMHRQQAPRILKPGRSQGGYPTYSLCGRTRLAHRIVLETFVGPPPSPLHQGAHNNGIKTDSRLSNLRWATKKENDDDKRLHGTILKGSDVAPSKMTEEQVAEARCLYIGGGFTQQALADRFGVHRATMGRALSGQDWKHVTATVTIKEDNKPHKHWKNCQHCGRFLVMDSASPTGWRCPNEAGHEMR